MISITATRVNPDKVDQLRSWMAEVQNTRQAEARVTLANEGVRHERAVLVETSDGPLLVYVVECEDYEVARAAFEKSEHPIDVEHKQVMAEVRGTPLSLEDLLNLEL